MHFPRPLALTVIALLACAVAACGKQKPAVPVAQPAAPASSASAVTPAPGVVQGWMGTWLGQEGMVLTLTAKQDTKVDVLIVDLDGERRFEGVASFDHIQFERDGIQERIMATDGEATGMKWLANESNCLTVKEGEGYCRKPTQ
jgi:hypothetical protein